MKKIFYTACLFSALLFAQSCGEKKTAEGEQTDTTQTVTETPVAETPAPEGLVEKDGLKLYYMSSSPEFADAKLAISTPADKGKAAAGDVKFAYTVTDYQLGAQTDDAAGKMCANSDKGQHIHLILNNGPYSAQYEPNFVQKLEAGHYVALSFISRSYHESIKTAGAYTLTQFNVGGGKESKDLTKPYLFYSRPKGEYTGEDTKRLMLDFYLANTTISADGNKVKATINGKTEFILTEWRPYIIEGLPMGDNKIQLDLIDKDGKLVEGGFNQVERTFKLNPLQ